MKAWRIFMKNLKQWKLKSEMRKKVMKKQNKC